MRHRLALFSFVLITAPGVWASAGTVDSIERAAAAPPLFAATSTLDIELETDLRALRNPKREAGFQPAILRWRADGQSGELAVGVSPRGRFRLDRENCQFPPLFLQFSEDATGIFAGQGIVPVTTHCATGNAQYVVAEYLVYRTHALLTHSSISARLARTRYIDSLGRGRPLDTMSFLTEHFDLVARRVGAVVVEDSGLRFGESEPHATALVNVFQYLIGNTDWSALAQHNVALLRTGTGDLVPLPYDFDFAGVIDARYAAPSDKLPIRSVTQRVYRGFCQSDGLVEGAIAHIRDRRQAIFELYRQTPELDPRLVKRSLRYYEGFFEIVDSPEALRREILDACRKIPRARP